MGESAKRYIGFVLAVKFRFLRAIGPFLVMKRMSLKVLLRAERSFKNVGDSDDFIYKNSSARSSCLSILS